MSDSIVPYAKFRDYLRDVPAQAGSAGVGGMAACFAAARVLTQSWVTAGATMVVGLVLGLLTGYPLWLRRAARAEREAPLNASPSEPATNVRTLD